jgi:hypothetical protein
MSASQICPQFCDKGVLLPCTGVQVHNDDDVRALFKQVQGEVPGSPIFIMKLASQVGVPHPVNGTVAVYPSVEEN